jgi:hypothetical protein
MTSINYKKEYLPGYTGHVPFKNDIYGCTAGDINKIITGQTEKASNYDVDAVVGKPASFAQRDLYSVKPPIDGHNDQIQYGNNSKKGENWLGGPNNNIKAQHIPRYAGFVPQIKSENLYGKSFAKITGAAINTEYEKGQMPSQKERFVTTTGNEFNKGNFRRLKEDVDPAEARDLQNAANFHDAE